MVSIVVTVKSYRPEVATQVYFGARRGILAATESVRNEAIRLILSPPKTGRIYHRRSVTHQASAPGEAPASDTGRLVNSIRTEYSPDGLRGSVVASTGYAAKLEFGTPRVAARPYMRPALANMKGTIGEVVQRAVRSALEAAP